MIYPKTSVRLGGLVNSLKITFMVVFVVGISSGCGRPAQKVNLKNEQLDAIKDPSCKKSSCPELAYSLVDDAGVDLTSGSKSGSVGTPVNWVVQVKTTGVASRIKIAIVEAASWMEKKSLSKDGGIAIVGTPVEVASRNAVIILARDMGRCVAMEANAKSCSDPEASFDKYDRKFNLDYTITAGPGNTGSIPSTPSTPAVTPSGASNPPSGQDCGGGGILSTIKGVIPFSGILSGNQNGNCS